MTAPAPSYLKLNGAQWAAKEEHFQTALRSCTLCPRQCRAERSSGQAGVCQAAGEARIASHNLHHGEEPPISGSRGSGTVFFSGCTLKCVFCQNFPISQLNHGSSCSVAGLAAIFVALQKRGAHNINLVSPTPYLPHVVSALRLAAAGGLKIPLVYNTSGWERPEVIAQLEGLVDVWLPDLKYSGSSHGRELGKRLSAAPDYFGSAFPAIAEMFRQSGLLQLDEEGLAVRGLIVRHLIVPGEADNSIEVLQAFRRGPFRDAHLALMSQYFPAHRASCIPGIDRPLRREEYERVKAAALDLGVENGWFQDMDAEGGA